jgi:catechol 2,3-dioxygenase-like lactoylglutathione lyase family enzyme
MFKDNHAFSGFSVDNLDKAQQFYGDVLGMDVTKEPMGILSLKINKGTSVMIYPKDNHQPATFTILNIPVPDVEAAVDEMTAKGIEFITYDEGDLKTDDKGIAAGDGQGPKIAWFKDPAGNILSVLEERPQ